MKNNYLLKILALIAIVIASICGTNAQIPQGFNYQAVLRNSVGQVMKDTSVTMKFTINKATPNGTSVYEETQGTTTNDFGLVTLQIGEGAPTIGNFSSIQWGTNTYYLQVHADIGSGYIYLGTTQFISVPYSMVADTVLHGGVGGTAGGDLSGTYPNPTVAKIQTYAVSSTTPTNGQVLQYNGTNWTPTTQNTNNGWNLTGNAGTDPSTNFLGTTDNQSLIFRVNNNQSGFIGNSNNSNTCFGYSSLLPNTGVANTAFGYFTLTVNSTGVGNSVMGCDALRFNTTGGNNTAMGSNALSGNTTGNENTAIGGNALNLNMTGIDNVAVGYQSLNSNTTNNNVAIGALALKNNTTGFDNTAIGALSMITGVTGNYNTAVGYTSMNDNSSGSYNAALGQLALSGNTTGSNNTGIGCYSLQSNTTGSNNTAIGIYSDVNGNNLTNATSIGYFGVTNASNKIVLGNNAVTVIGGYTNWSNLSDGRFKQDINENVPGLAFINKLRPVEYRLNMHKLNAYTYGKKTTEYEKAMADGIAAKEKVVYSGFVAQEVEQAAKAIGYNFSGVVPPQNDKDHYSLRYAEFVVPLVKGMQEQQAMIEQQHTVIDQLQKQVAELQSQINKLQSHK